MRFNNQILIDETYPTIMGSYQHAYIEPVTAQDTTVMKELFSTWKWQPRPVAIFVDGMNMAGSLSGMPHSLIQHLIMV